MTNHLQISLSDRWAIIGATGAGKTVFSRRLLWAYGRGTRGQIPIYILDTKGYMLSQRKPPKDDFKEFRAKGLGILHRGNTAPKITLPGREGPFRIWQPEEDNPDMYDEFFHNVYKSGIPAVLYMDELSSIMEGRKAPRYFSILQKQGRGLDIALLSTTQSPAFIPEDLLRQVTHLVRFRLNDSYDVDKLAKRGGQRLTEEPVHDYGFWYRNATRPVKKYPPVYYEDYKTFFGDE